ncbi:hypothetical protein N9I68_01605 [Bacteroidia bacterium]|nr:hypothetical protein [Bacteroidia bacterium]
MKKYIVIVVLGLFTFGVQSCKKPPLPVLDEPTDTSGGGSGGGVEEEVKVSPYVGTWDYSKIDLKNGTLSLMGQDIGEFIGVGRDISGKVIITEKPNRYTTDLSFTAAVTVFGQEQELPVDKQTSSGTWTEANGEISLTDDGGQPIGILSSTSSKIVFTGNFTEAIDVQFGSIEANSDVEFTITK